MPSFTKHSVVLIALLCLAGCKEDPVTQPPGGDRSYMTTLWIQPGPADGPDTVSNRGCQMWLWLSADRTMRGSTRYVAADRKDTTNSTFNGTYSVAGDTIRFQSDNAPHLTSETWIQQGGTITNLVRTWRAPVVVVFSTIPLD